MENRYKEQQALNAALAQWTEGHNVFGTLKFMDGTQTSADRAGKSIRKFWNKIDRVFYPSNAVSKGIRIPRVVVMHKGYSGENIHYHFTAKVPFTSAFIDVAKTSWADLDWYTTNADNVVIEQVRDLKSAYHYLAHEYTKLGSETLQEDTTHWQIPSYCAEKYKNLGQVRRIARAQGIIPKN